MAAARSDSPSFRAEDSAVATASTIRQHYYPEGGWGWVVVLCIVLVQVLAHGIHGAAGVWLQETLGHFPVGLTPAGMSGRVLQMAAVSGVRPGPARDGSGGWPMFRETEVRGDVCSLVQALFIAVVTLTLF
jgi:hypothetical protein